jgi:hypothetical protein
MEVITTAQQHYVQISYTEFCTNWRLNVGSTDIKLIYNPLKKAGLSMFQFLYNPQVPDTFLWTFLYWDNLFTPLNEVWLSLYKFSQNSQVLNSITWRSPTWHSIQISQEIWKECVDTDLFPLVNCDCHWIDYQKTHACLITLCKNFMNMWQFQSLILSHRRLLSPYRVFCHYFIKNTWDLCHCATKFYVNIHV